MAKISTTIPNLLYVSHQQQWHVYRILFHLFFFFFWFVARFTPIFGLTSLFLYSILLAHFVRPSHLNGIWSVCVASAFHKAPSLSLQFNETNPKIENWKSSVWRIKAFRSTVAAIDCCLKTNKSNGKRCRKRAFLPIHRFSEWMDYGKGKYKYIETRSTDRTKNQHKNYFPIHTFLTVRYTLNFWCSAILCQSMHRQEQQCTKHKQISHTYWNRKIVSQRKIAVCAVFHVGMTFFSLFHCFAVASFVILFFSLHFSRRQCCRMLFHLC